MNRPARPPARSLARSTGSRFLRNKEEKEEEIQSRRDALMGVRPLDSSDVDHLNSVSARKQLEKRKREEEEEVEVGIFRRKREIRREFGGEVDAGAGETQGGLQEREEEGAKRAQESFGRGAAEGGGVKVKVIKKKRRKAEEGKGKEDKEEDKGKQLFGAYGSDSDSD